MSDGYYSIYQQRALEWCRQNYGACPLSCAKDGAANCEYFVRRLECEPAKVTYLTADAEQWRIDAEKKRQGRKAGK